MRTTWLLLGTAWAGVLASAQVVTYEGDVFPEQVGWERVQYLDCERTLDGEWLTQRCDLGSAPGPIGETDYYRQPLAGFAGATSFFIEWRVTTNVPKELFDVAGIATLMSAAGRSGTNYHFTLTEGLVRLIRDNLLPIVFADLSADSQHTYRLELSGGDEYAWYIDGFLVDAGVPEGHYPTQDSFLLWGARHNVYDNESAWDFVRYGRQPEDASGDYDTNGEATLFDYHFVHDCLTKDGELYGGPWQAGPGSGPGCAFVDSDSDRDTDLFDFAEFQNLFGS